MKKLTKEELEEKVVESQRKRTEEYLECLLRKKAITEGICPDCGNQLIKSPIKFLGFLTKGEKYICSNCGLEHM